MPRIGDIPKSQLQYIGDHFDSFQQNGSGYVALCPLHGDSRPSLSINEGTNGGVVIRCHAGCPTKGILDVIGLRMSDLAPNARRIVASYDYNDENGELLYQSVRYEPKDFRQRKRSEDGGWDWRTKDVRKVLYRYPELLRAAKVKPVYIVEGEKDVDRLRELGFVATCNVGGAGKWLSAYNDSLVSRHAVIVPDNDPAGWEHAEQVSRHLQGVAATVRILELPGLPLKGDLSDWLDAGGTRAQLLALVRDTPKAGPYPSGFGPSGPENDPKGNSKGTTLRVAKNPGKAGGKPEGLPEGLDPKGVVAGPEGADPKPEGLTHRVLPFPVDVWPGDLQDFVESVATALPCPVDFPSVMMLPVMGALIGRQRRIQIKESWQELPLIWCAVVARSGERKTPSFEMATDPLRSRQAILLAEYIQAKQEYAALSVEEKDDTPKPRLKQIATTDTTIEALKDVLSVNSNGIIYPADELAGWARSIGQYKGGRGDDRQIWLSIWSSTQIVSNRKGNPEPIVINDPFVAITGGIQPDALPDLIDDSREDGFSARLLFAWPDPVPHGNWTDDVVQRSSTYLSICEQLYDLPHLAEPVKVSPAAKVLWVEWVNAHRAETPRENLRPVWAKAEGHCLRLTLILHVARQLCNATRSADVDEQSMSGGIKLIEYFKSHATRVYGNVAKIMSNDRVGKALRWIRRQDGPVTARVAHLNGFCKDSAEAVELFQHLQSQGHGIVTHGKQGKVTFTLAQPGPTQEAK